MSEIFTLDSKYDLKIDDISQDIPIDISEQVSLGRVYRVDHCFGTGFIIATTQKGPILLTCKHIAIDMFTSTVKDV